MGDHYEEHKPISYRQAHTNSVNQTGNKRKRKRKGKFFLIIFLLIIGVGAYFVFNLYQQMNYAFDQMYEPIGSAVPRLRDTEITLGDDPFSILILGLDEGRTDSMMVATVNPTLDTTYLLSIPRDTMIHFPGLWTSRINHAFAYGGIDLTIETVQNFLNIPIDYHVSLYMDQFHSLVDAFGGITVNNDAIEFSMGGYNFPLGEITLTGSMAYYYVRMRMDDPRGDFGRQERQRDVLAAMVNELAGVTVVTRYQDILDSVGDNMRTNIMLNEMITMSLGYNRALRNVTNLGFQASGSITNGMYLIPIPEDQLGATSQRLRRHLELE